MTPHARRLLQGLPQGPDVVVASHSHPRLFLCFFDRLDSPSNAGTASQPHNCGGTKTDTPYSAFKSLFRECLGREHSKNTASGALLTTLGPGLFRRDDEHVKSRKYSVVRYQNHPDLLDKPTSNEHILRRLLLALSPFQKHR
jgi:hypothetical protein